MMDLQSYKLEYKVQSHGGEATKIGTHIVSKNEPCRE